MSKPLVRNALANVLQTFLGAILLFALFRYINITLGVEQLGVWSVVLATVSASRIAELGLSAGVIRFVARDLARGETDGVNQVIDTVVLTLMLIIGLALPLLYFLIAKVLPHIFSSSYLAQAIEILPYALCSLWLTIVATVFQGGLDGCQRMDLRAGLVIVGQVHLLGLSFLWVPEHGLLGLAWAQIGQGILLVVAGRFLLRHTLPTLPRLPRHWRKKVLLSMLGYGANFQAATLFMMLLDPITNALMARFGGPASAGYFTMANQVVLKVRSVIVTANQAVVPYIATFTDSEPERLRQFYRENLRVLLFVALPPFVLLYAWAGELSWLFTSGYQPEFIFFLGLLSLAWFINTFAGPAYFMNMGIGSVGWNTLSHLIMGILNISLGWILGNLCGANGVLLAYTIAIVSGSGTLFVVFHKQNLLSWQDIFSREHVKLFTSCIIVVAFGWVEPLQNIFSHFLATTIELLVQTCLIIFAVWSHPIRRLINQWLIGAIIAK